MRRSVFRPELALALALVLFVIGSAVRAQCPPAGCPTGYSFQGPSYSFQGGSYSAAAPSYSSGGLVPVRGGLFGLKTRWVQSAPCAASVVPVVPTGQVPGTAAQQSAVAVAGDPRGFVGMLNAERARRGLAPLAYDPGLESWAASNNAQQCARGLGHFVSAGTGQCSAMAWDAATALGQWCASGPHAAILFSPTASVCGFAIGGGFATANVGSGY